MTDSTQLSADRQSWLDDVRAAYQGQDSERLAALLSHRSVEELVAAVHTLRSDSESLFQSVGVSTAADVLEDITPREAQAVLEELPADTAVEVLDEIEDEHAGDILESMSPESAAELLEDLPPEDAADVIEVVARSLAADLLQRLPAEVAGDIVEHLDDDIASELLSMMPPEQAADLLEDLRPRDAVDVLQEMTSESAAQVLERVEPEERSDIDHLLAYPDDTAGGQMTKAFLCLPQSETVAQAVAAVRRWAAEEETGIHYLYVADENGALGGVIPLHRLVIADEGTPLGSLVDEDVISVRVDEDQEDVARKFRKYRYLALPVVDEQQRLVGIIRHDDIMEVLEEEATEDAHVMVGLSLEERVYTPVWESARRRLPWLFVNLGTAATAAWVVNRFQMTIAKVTALAVLMPMVAGQGGNAGSQTLTILVRSLALGEVDRHGVWRALRKEVAIGCINGLVFGCGIGVLGWLWQGEAWLGVVVGVAMLLNMVAASLAGCIVPLGLRLCGVDPALASAILVTMVTDCAGFFFFLGLATVALRLLH